MLIGQKILRGAAAGGCWRSAARGSRRACRRMACRQNRVPGLGPQSAIGQNGHLVGRCTNGHADGFGTVQWLKGNKPIETDKGEWRDGRQAGKGVQNWPIGRYEGELADGLPNGQGVLTFQKYRYEGQFRDGKPNGIGTLTEGNQAVQGTWKDGCLQGQRKASIGIPLSDCR